MAIALPLAFAVGLIQVDRLDEDMTLMQNVSLTLLGWAAFLGANVYLLAARGQTVGKLLLGTRIVDMEGKPCSLNRLILLRYFLPALIAQIPCAGSLFALADALFIFEQQKRCIHDYMAGTKVVLVNP